MATGSKPRTTASASRFTTRKPSGISEGVHVDQVDCMDVSRVLSQSGVKCSVIHLSRPAF